MVRHLRTEKITDITEGLLRRIDPSGARHYGRVVNAWENAAGAEIARHTSAAAFKSGELVVCVDSPGWATELTFMSDHLRSAINTEIGQELVRSIRFTVSRRVALKRREAMEARTVNAFYAADDESRLPLSETERQQAIYAASVIKDERLRETALRVMIKDLERKKALLSAKTPYAPSRAARDDTTRP
ncbi:MAG: DUF721 domain-containing protein [Coriobacteriales bacterium]